MYYHPPHGDNVTAPHGSLNLLSRYISATTGRENHKVHKGHVVALKKKLPYWRPLLHPQPEDALCLACVTGIYSNRDRGQRLD
jgi:hypothetical protein